MSRRVRFDNLGNYRPQNAVCCGHNLGEWNAKASNQRQISNLSEIRGNGLGQKAAALFRTYLPEGVKFTFAIDEIYTKGLLLFITEKLMEKGEITDWRINSPLRPCPQKGERIYLPETDQKMIQNCFFDSLKNQESPLLKILEKLKVKPCALRTRLEEGGTWIFSLITVC